MRYLIGLWIAVVLSGCGLSVKAGPLSAGGAVVTDDIGASVEVTSAEGKRVFGVDLRAAVDGVLAVINGAIEKL